MQNPDRCVEIQTEQEPVIIELEGRNPDQVSPDTCDRGVVDDADAFAGPGKCEGPDEDGHTNAVKRDDETQAGDQDAVEGEAKPEAGDKDTDHDVSGVDHQVAVLARSDESLDIRDRTAAAVDCTEAQTTIHRAISVGESSVGYTLDITDRAIKAADRAITAARRAIDNGCSSTAEVSLQNALGTINHGIGTAQGAINTAKRAIAAGAIEAGERSMKRAMGTLKLAIDAGEHAIGVSEHALDSGCSMVGQRSQQRALETVNRAISAAGDALGAVDCAVGVAQRSLGAGTDLMLPQPLQQLRTPANSYYLSCCVS